MADWAGLKRKLAFLFVTGDRIPTGLVNGRAFTGLDELQRLRANVCCAEQFGCFTHAVGTSPVLVNSPLSGYITTLAALR